MMKKLCLSKTFRKAPQSYKRMKVAPRAPIDLFPGLTHVQCEQALRQAVLAITHTVAGITDTMLEHMQASWRVDETSGLWAPPRDVRETLAPHIQEAYCELRADGFSHEEVVVLVHAARYGGVPTLLTRGLEKERETGRGWIKGARARLQEQEDELRSYFAQRTVPYPTRKTDIVPIGRYGALTLASAEDGHLSVFGGKARFLEEAGAIYIRVDGFPLDTQTGAPDDATMQLLGHERFHALAPVCIPEESGEVVLQNEKMPGFQAGILKRESTGGGLEYGTLNEGVTEYLARGFARTAQYQYKHGSYDEEVESLGLLLAYLSRHGGTEPPDRRLLRQYTERSGLTAFEQDVNVVLGEQGLVMCNMLLTRPSLMRAFLEGVRTQSAGGVPTPIELSLDMLENARPAVDIERMRGAYPFIRVHTHVRDAESGEWRRVPYEAPPG